MTADGQLSFIILVDAGDNDVHKIREAFLKLDAISIAHCPLGPTDLICYGKAASMSELKDIMSTQMPQLLEDQFNPIEKTETLLVLDHFGDDLTAERFSRPNGTGAWIFTDQKISSRKFTEKLVNHHPEIIAAFNVLGSHDGVFYAEAETLDRLMDVIDEGFRTLRGIGAEGKPMKALSRTDTRLVLM
ncbi:Lrp/AsnC ligand binding domain-containing protein [Parendozoicomonas haliclonae]|uniref:AsnC family protein n=1 Tax=Parendozoicomonas haliclonae TaxID=1960125 RepID=A0A1X7AJU1_9GAMM|nr:Lrp/AsnC ligand binding domain-containing protein [Parendozoicomonas haliclonae]SMA46389.1 AsnC family protein [Parendozoicomonas haliclonae]